MFEGIRIIFVKFARGTPEDFPILILQSDTSTNLLRTLIRHQSQMSMLILLIAGLVKIEESLRPDGETLLVPSNNLTFI